MAIKFNPEGRVLMVFGRKREASDEDTARQASNGAIELADPEADVETVVAMTRRRASRAVCDGA
jgi:hypothetical protein